MEANARARAVRAESGSLTESGEEDEFVLTCPLSSKTSEVEDGSRPPKQRRRESHESGVSGPQFMGRRESCASLGSGLASASSLFGMEIYQEEGNSVSSPPLYRSTTPFSSHSLKSKNSGSHGALSSKDGEDGYAPLGMHHRFRRSEHSFGSLGLSLDGPSYNEQGRDLVTPPVTRQVAFSPPPLTSQPVQADSFYLPPKSENESKDSPRAMDAEEQTKTVSLAARATMAR